MNKSNAQKSTFKERLMSLAAHYRPGDVITDSTLRNEVHAMGLTLTINEARRCIWELEDKIGSHYNLRLKRVRNFGFEVLNSVDQSNLAADEGSDRIRRASKKASKRLGHVDTMKLPEQYRPVHVSKRLAFDALAAIAGYTVGRAGLTNAEVKVVDNAMSDLRALEAIKKANRQ